RSLNDPARRHVAAVVDAPHADEPGPVRIPRRGPDVAEAVELVVVLHGHEDLSARLVGDELTNLDDAGSRAGDHRPRRDVAVVGSIEDENTVVRFAAAGLDPVRHDDEVADL